MTYVTPVDAGFANRYGFSATASAKLTFKIVPVPPPDGMDQARVMPDLAGRKIGDALLVLDMLDLAVRIVDQADQAVSAPDAAAVVSETTPVAGTVVRTDGEIVIKLKQE